MLLGFYAVSAVEMMKKSTYMHVCMLVAHNHTIGYYTTNTQLVWILISGMIIHNLYFLSLFLLSSPFTIHASMKHESSHNSHK